MSVVNYIDRFAFCECSIAVPAIALICSQAGTLSRLHMLRSRYSQSLAYAHKQVLSVALMHIFVTPFIVQLVVRWGNF